MARIAGWLAAALLVSACGSSRIVSTTDGHGALHRGERDMIINSPRVVHVYGSPPDRSSPEEFAALLRFPDRPDGPPFVAAPPTGRGARLVAVYGAPPGRPCLASSGSNISLPLRLTMAFCRDNAQISKATLRNDSLTGPSDPAFSRALDNMMRALTRESRLRRRR